MKLPHFPQLWPWRTRLIMSHTHFLWKRKRDEGNVVSVLAKESKTFSGRGENLVVYIISLSCFSVPPVKVGSVWSERCGLCGTAEMRLHFCCKVYKTTRWVSHNRSQLADPDTQNVWKFWTHSRRPEVKEWALLTSWHLAVFRQWVQCLCLAEGFHAFKGSF